MAIELPAEAVLRLAHPSLAYSTTDDEHVHKLNEICKAFLATRFNHFIEENRGEVLRISYQSDSTDRLTRETWKRTWDEFSAVRRTKQPGTYLAQRAFAETVSGARQCKFTEPIRCKDKTAGSSWKVARELVKFPFEYGCTNANIYDCVFDRAVFEPVSEMLAKDPQSPVCRYSWRQHT